MRLEPFIVPKCKEVLGQKKYIEKYVKGDIDGRMSKRHRNQLKEFLNVSSGIS